MREHTDDARLAALDAETQRRVSRFLDADEATLSARIEEVEQESDMERVLEANASVLALAGVALGGLHTRRWLLLPTVVLLFLLQHAIQGWCPPVVLFRRLGVRTRQEIDAEKHALKALRGDDDALIGR